MDKTEKTKDEEVNRKTFEVENDGIYFIPEQIHRFIKEIEEALTDKSKHGTKLSVLETSMLLGAKKILKQIK